MQLTLYSDYSLRVLIHLAVSPRPLVTIDEIASAFDISRAHLTKVVSNLTALGLVEPVRGRGGGLRLARPAAEVGIGEVVRETENLALVECERDDGACVLAPACVLRRALREALDAFLAVLDRYTLADLTRRRSPLQRLLAIESG